MPSVTEAIRSLVAKRIGKNTSRMKNVELTKEGLDLARNIAHRHSAVKEFLITVLGLSEEDAEKEACGIEHAIRPETLNSLLKFIDFIRANGNSKPIKLEDFKYYLKHGEYPPNCDSAPRYRHGWAHAPGNGDCHLRPTITSTKLSDLCPGMKGRIAFVSGKGPIRKRLMEMGLTSDTDFEVIRVAPLGDPIEIRVRGYNLSLRKSEAEHVEVEVEQ